MNNLHKSWQQGRFIDHPRYRNWSGEAKIGADRSEKLKVRPSPLENAICQCSTPEEAEWVASRLNMAAELEKLAHDYVSERISEDVLWG